MSAVAEPVWLSPETVLDLHAVQLRRFGGAPGMRDEGLLVSAIGRPLNQFEYTEADLADLAAAYAFGTARNHPFIDGNKRTAFAAMMVFLRQNGVMFRPSPAEATVAILDLAAGETSQEGLARWIRDRSAG